jgi:hypothetical protein
MKNLAFFGKCCFGLKIFNDDHWDAAFLTYYELYFAYLIIEIIVNFLY